MNSVGWKVAICIGTRSHAYPLIWVLCNFFRGRSTREGAVESLGEEPSVAEPGALRTASDDGLFVINRTSRIIFVYG